MKSQSSQYTCAHTDLDECMCAKAGYETETPSFCERTMAYKVWYGKSSPNELSSMKSGHRISSLLALLHPLCAPPFQYAAGSQFRQDVFVEICAAVVSNR